MFRIFVRVVFFHQRTVGRLDDLGRSRGGNLQNVVERSARLDFSPVKRLCSKPRVSGIQLPPLD